MSNTLEDRYVEIVNLVKAYPNPFGEDIRVVDGFDLRIKQGEMIGILGHSGCGKSTVLTMIAGLNEISGGNVVVAGKEIDGAGPDRSVVFQSPCLFPWMTALGNVMLGVKRVYPHATQKERRELAEYYLNQVGLIDAMHKYPREMSGGMQQRVGIARAIALKPKMLLLDEPFGRLDSLTRMELQDVILDILNQNQVTTLLVTHDVDEAIYMCDRIVTMTNGPHARVGRINEMPFERPRVRQEVLDHPEYYNIRGSLIQYLEDLEHEKENRGKASEQTDDNTASEDSGTDLEEALGPKKSSGEKSELVFML
ncbi:MAG: ABC transporter ATP-binding protein [Phycisphaeraceae bacterium JB051]